MWDGWLCSVVGQDRVILGVSTYAAAVTELLGTCINIHLQPKGGGRIRVEAEVLRLPAKV